MTNLITRVVFFIVFPLCMIALMLTFIFTDNSNAGVIAYVGFDADLGRSVVRVIDLNTEIDISLTGDFQEARNPQWSPDGERLLFISDFGQTQRIAVIDMVGSNGRYISPPSQRNQAYIEPRWVSDGEQVAFNQVQDFTRAIYVLETFVYNLPERLDNESPILQDYVDQIALNNGQLSVSLELIGSRWGIVFQDQNRRDVLYYISTQAVQNGSVLVPSPNGEKIVFSDEVNGVLELFVMDVDGGHLRQLTYGGGIDPVWRP